MGDTYIGYYEGISDMQHVVSILDVTGKYAMDEDHGKLVARLVKVQAIDQLVSTILLDFAGVKIFCSNFWAGLFCGDLKYFDDTKFVNFPPHQFGSVDATIRIVLQKQYAGDFDLFTYSLSLDRTENGGLRELAIKLSSCK